MTLYQSDVLVSTEWTDQHKNDKSVQLVEVDEDNSVYGTGHIENAVFWD
ncbi:MAG TPA: hypothetical protein VK108_01165 [Pseudogracilibacillus sp.]|nr:hypothetical protein [Pseudogracilibacillus sp.]